MSEQGSPGAEIARPLLKDNSTVNYMITIHKYQFELNPNIEIGMHENAKVLDVQLQGDHWTMWVMEDTDKPKVTKKFKAYWTGEELNEMDIKRTHIATIQDIYVWHIFE